MFNMYRYNEFIHTSYWNKRDLNQLLPQNNNGLKGHVDVLSLFFYQYNKGLNQLNIILHTGEVPYYSNGVIG